MRNGINAGFVSQTGLSGYDAAVWTDWVPIIDRVHIAGGMQCLFQITPKGAKAGNETTVRATDKHVLLFWTAGTPSVDCKIMGRPTRMRISPWVAAYLPAGVDSWWASTPAAANQCFHIHLEEELFDGIRHESAHGKLRRLSPLLAFSDPPLSGLARMLFERLAESARPQRLVWDTLACAVAIRLIDLCADAAVIGPVTGGLAAWQSKRVTDYLKAHTSKEVTLAELAAIANLSPYHFARAFKQSTGLPPHKYQIMLRIERAKDLLADSLLPISDVSTVVGYEDQSYFAKWFRRIVGVTPSDYRRERQS
jgi:AraC family transcriptional regulator